MEMSDYVYTDSIYAQDYYNMTTIDMGWGIASSVKIWVYARKDSEYQAPFNVNAYLNGEWKTPQFITLTTDWAWYSKEYTGTFTQNDIDNLQIRLKYGNPPGESSSVEVAAAYAEINYTKKGLISTTIGATPFYTNESNPRSINLNKDESQLVTFWVNAM